MFKQSSMLSLVLPATHFPGIRDEATPVLIECYCAFCGGLIGVSAERAVLDIARQKHLCVDQAV